MKYTLLVLLLLIVPQSAASAEKDCIVVFRRTPGIAEMELVRGARGIVKRRYNLIPAMAVTLPDQGIDAIVNHRTVAYVEPDGIFKASDEYRTHGACSI